MGKRKRSTSSDRKGGPIASSADDRDSETSSYRKRIKRIKQEVLEDHHFTVPSAAFSSSNSRINGLNDIPEVLPPVQPMEEVQDDDYDVWLVRKPTEVLPDEIAHMKFPKKARSSSKLVKISCRQRKTLGATDQLDCRFEPPRCQMFHIHTKIANNAKHLRNLKPCAKIKGVVRMNRVEKLIDEFPILPDEDFLDAEQQPGQQNTEELMVPSSLSMPVSIASIRRKPVLDFKGLKERLKVFGGNQPSVVERKRK